MLKERTLRGVFSGKRLVVAREAGQPVVVTVWDGLLLTKRDLTSYPYVLQWRGRWLMGGMWWVLMPHALGRNPRSAIYYPDTFLNVVTRPIRRWLMPGTRLWRWLGGK